MIDPTRLPLEIVTNTIIKNLFESNDVDFDNYTILGDIRRNESPNSEKDIIIIKDSN